MRALLSLHPAALFAMTAVALSCSPSRPSPDGGRRRDGAVSTTPDPAEWTECQSGQVRCYRDVVQHCIAVGEFTELQQEDCHAIGQVCAPDPAPHCQPCIPGRFRCARDATAVEQCAPDGMGWGRSTECNADNGEACRNEACVVLCRDSSIADTNIGCEYYATDLDNAVTGDGQSAASQQFAVVVSNPDRNLTARVRIEWNTAPQGMPPLPSMVASAVIAPMDLEVFPLPAREVDCSAPGTFNTGTGTCLSSQAYRITSTIPVIAYQFNPLENARVFSNDASLLVPTNSLSGDYVVMSWPQTIARSNTPTTNFDTDLRTFVTIVGTAADTNVTVTPSTTIIPGGPLTAPALPGVPFTVHLGPFDVLNLETGAFGADLTGTRIATDRSVAVFAGSEASDAPAWSTLSDRSCCADHMEEQLYPRRTVGRDYVAVRMPPRTPAVSAAGGVVAVVDEPQWFRVLAVSDGMTHVTTTLPNDPNDPTGDPLEFNLMAGEHRTLRAMGDFRILADHAVSVATFTGSQQTTGIPFTLPGGDPSFIMVPPTEQWRANYVFLTPDQYAFDFVTIVARPQAHVQLDDTPLPYTDCPMQRADACVDRVGQPPCPAPTYVVYRCQLSFPMIVDGRPPENVRPGRQADGVHSVTSDDDENGVMVIVSGFDSFVGYGYPAGTRLTTVN